MSLITTTKSLPTLLCACPRVTDHDNETSTPIPSHTSVSTHITDHNNDILSPRLLPKLLCVSLTTPLCVNMSLTTARFRLPTSSLHFCVCLQVTEHDLQIPPPPLLLYSSVGLHVTDYNEISSPPLLPTLLCVSTRQ